MTKKSKKFNRKKILGVNVDFDLSVDQAVDYIDSLIRKKRGNHLIATTSPFFIMSAQKDSSFKSIVNNAALSVPDGVGVLYANYYQKKIKNLKKGPLYPIKALYYGLMSGVEGFTKKEVLGKTITGVELTHRLCELASKNNYSVFILGGRKRDNKGRVIENTNYDMAQDAATRLMTMYPNLRIVGATSQFSRQPKDDNKTVQYIHDCMIKENIKSIDILLVAYNPIQQEKWIQRNANKIPTMTSMGIGRTLNYITKDMQQPSKKYEEMHISWLYTFIKQPWRVKRVLMTFPIFPLKVYIESIKSSENNT